MTIIEALQTHSLILTNGKRRMVGINGIWIVSEIREGWVEGKTLITTNEESEAVRVLLGKRRKCEN